MEIGDGGFGGLPQHRWSVPPDQGPKQAKRKMKTPLQIDALEEAYTVSSRPSERMRLELARKTGLSSREISMWFANKRFQGKQALLLRESMREDEHRLALHPCSSGNRVDFGLAACNYICSSMSEESVLKSCDLPWSMPVAPFFIMQSHELQKNEQKMMRQPRPLHDSLDSSIVNYVERKLGGPLRADGPLLGVNFDPLPPYAFGASLNIGNENAVQNQISLAANKSQQERQLLLPASAVNGFIHHPALDLQFGIHSVSDVVDKYVTSDKSVPEISSQLERLQKREFQSPCDRERCVPKRNDREEDVIHERQSDEKLQLLNEFECYNKSPKKATLDVEKVMLSEELLLEAVSGGKPVNDSIAAHAHIHEGFQLVDDEQLELMMLAASLKGLSSITFLDNDTLNQLHSFTDLLGAFPPESVTMKRPFAIPPWTESEENVGNLLMVWKFLITFAGDYGLWPFTLEEFAQAFHDLDSRLLREIHVALLKYIIKDLEDVEGIHAYAPGINENNVEYPGLPHSNIVTGAHAWGFDIHFWKKRLNFLTWPEILRQLALSAGYGPKLKKSNSDSYFNNDKGGDLLASLDHYNASGTMFCYLRERDEDLGSNADKYQLVSELTDEKSNKSSTHKPSNSFHRVNEVARSDESGLINQSGLEYMDKVSSVFQDSSEDQSIFSAQNGQFFDYSRESHVMINDDSDIDINENVFRSWVQGLTEGEYSDLSIEERLDVLVALVGFAVEGHSFRGLIEERMKEAQTCEKMMWTKMRLDRRLQEECRSLVHDAHGVNKNPVSFCKQVLEKFEHVSPFSCSKLQLYIGNKAELLHSYRFLPLGCDRRHNRYWQFSTSSRNDPGSGTIFFESKDGFWRVIDSEEAFDALVAALETQGIRESQLYHMLNDIEATFKEACRRNKGRNFCADSATDDMQVTSAPECCNTDHRATCAFNHHKLQISASFKIELGNNETERLLSSKRYLQFMKWMWQECYNPSLLCAIRYGEKRCPQVLETCNFCRQSYQIDERHCMSCHATFDGCNNAYGNFSEHLTRCEADCKVQLADPFLPINIQLLKAHLSIIEASIPRNTYHSFWNEGCRKSWGMRLKLSSSAKDIFQVLTLLEGAINPNILSSNFSTTNELLRSEMGFSSGNTNIISKPVTVIPWIPDTSAAVAMRLLDLDASISYMVHQELEFPEDVDEEFIVLPRSTVKQHVFQIEPASPDDTDRRKGIEEIYGGDECWRNQIKGDEVERGASRSCARTEYGVLAENFSDLEDDSDSDDSFANSESSASSRGIEAGGMNREDDEVGDTFCVREAVESNEDHDGQENMDLFLDSED